MIGKKGGSQQMPASISHTTLTDLRKKVIDRIYQVLIFLGGAGLVAGSIDPLKDGNWLLVGIYAVLYGLILAAFLFKRLSVKRKSSVLLLGLLLFGFSELWYFGFGSLGFLYFYGAVILSCLLVSRRWGLGVLGLTSLGTFSIALIYAFGTLDMSSRQRQIADDLIDWLGPFLGYFALSLGSVIFIGMFINSLEKSIATNKKTQVEIEKSNQELQDTVTLLNTVISSLPGLFYMFDDPPRRMIRYNENMYKLTGYTEAEVKKMSLEDWVDREDRGTLRDILNTLDEHQTFIWEMPLVLKDGNKRPYLLTGRRFHLKGKPYTVGVGVDLVEMKEYETMFARVFEKSRVAIALIDPDGVLRNVNSFLAETVGLPRTAVIGRNISEFSPPEERNTRKQSINDLFAGKVTDVREERQYIGPDGRLFHADITMSLVPYTREGPLVVSFMIDISASKKDREELVKTLHDKELLIQEVHHRVRNNCQIMSSLTNMASTSVGDVDGFIKSTLLRLQALTLIHEGISEDFDYEHLGLRLYLTDLVSVVFKAFHADASQISVSIELNESIRVNRKIASPLGLICAELISNAVRHAFSDRSGIIKVSAREQAGILSLSIADDGAGLPDHFRDRETSGYKIIDSLVEQLDGTLTVESGSVAGKQGTTITVTVPQEPC